MVNRPLTMPEPRENEKSPPQHIESAWNYRLDMVGCCAKDSLVGLSGDLREQHHVERRKAEQERATEQAIDPVCEPTEQQQHQR